jgi:hypothetical protein
MLASEVGAQRGWLVITPVGPHDDALVPVTIVVPVDGSALSEMSVPLAQLLASAVRCCRAHRHRWWRRARGRC